jgi:hypothetical protein
MVEMFSSFGGVLEHWQRALTAAPVPMVEVGRLQGESVARGASQFDLKSSV